MANRPQNVPASIQTHIVHAPFTGTTSPGPMTSGRCEEEAGIHVETMWIL